MFAARNGVSLTITLAVSISLLVLVAVAAVLGVGLWSGTQNTLALLRDKAQFVTTAMAGKVRDHLRPAENQLAFIGRLVADGRVDPADKPAFATLMTGALAAAPQISAILHVDPDYQTTIVARSPGGPAFFTGTIHAIRPCGRPCPKSPRRPARNGASPFGVSCPRKQCSIYGRACGATGSFSAS